MSALRIRHLVLILVMGCPLVASGQPRERDVWHAYIEDGQRYGYARTTVSKLPDGNFRYAVETRLLIDLLGLQRQAITEQSEFIVTPTYQILSLRSEGEQLSGKTRAEGSVRNDKLVVTFDRAGIKGSREIDLSVRPIPRVCLGDWLNEQPGDMESPTVTVIHDVTWVTGPAAATLARRDESGSLWRVDLGVEGGRGTVLYDPEGVARELNYDVPRLHMKRCTAEEAKDISYHTLDGRSVLMFPIDKDIGHPDRLTALTIRLTWKDIPFDQFSLEDSRQRLVSKSEENGEYQAVIEITPPERTTSEASFPIRAAARPQGAGFAPYLADTRFIKPHNARITAAASEIVEGKRDAIEAVKALSTWVSKYVETSLIAETLSGPEVLECRKGKCSEYATLFASLARSVGIPARIVLGERMASGYWVGHMWNEAYVGRWIPVDASANEVGRSFALIKLIHSDTVAGTQSLRWALPQSLDISIEDFEMTVSPLSSRFTTGIHGRRYTNVDYACRLTAPDESWTLEDKSKPGVVTVRFKVPQEDDVLIHFVAFALPGEVQPKAVIDARLNLFKASYKEFEILQNGPREVNGAGGHTLRFRRAPGGEETGTILTTEVVWRQGAYGYLLNLIAEESAHNRHAAAFSKLVAGFEYLDDTEAPRNHAPK